MTEDEKLLKWARALWNRITDLMLTPAADDAYSRMDVTFRGGAVTVLILKHKEQADRIERWIESNYAVADLAGTDPGKPKQ